MKTILAATLPEKVAKVQSICEGLADGLVICVTMKDVLQALQQPPSIILCNIHFGYGQMYDLLQHVRAHPLTRQVPVICIDDSKEMLLPSIRQSIEIATRVVGAQQWIAFSELHKTLDDHGIKDAVRKTILEAMHSA